MSTNSRVCDRCIRRKVKCDLQRPICSRCSEAGSSCTYSKAKRKPGPPRGSRPKTRANPAARSSSHNERAHEATRYRALAAEPLQSQSAQERPLLNGDSGSQHFIQGLDDSGPNFLSYTPMVRYAANEPVFPGYDLNPSQERHLLLQFFDDVHPAVPLFQREKFFSAYDEGVACRDLIITIVTITAKILGPVDFWRLEAVDLCISSLLTTTACDSDSLGSRAGLDQFRQECLLAYYDFHQSPGSPAWMRISRLARKAYAIGLNQIENLALCSAFDSELTTEDDVEDWRYVWWCLYCLDSYSNISLGAPFVIDLESINTALARRSSTDDKVPDSPKLFLPDEEGQLWKTAQVVLSSTCEREFNIHIITTTILRQAGHVLRLRAIRKRVTDKLVNLRSNLASLRLALPPRYLNPTRNALTAERAIHHHLRLTNVLHLHMTRLIIMLPQDFKVDEAGWLDDWQQSLDTCHDIVSIVEQWNNQFSSRVDPAICFIAFVALWVLNLHRRCFIDANSPLLDKLIRSENLLLLFLEHFSKMWAMPNILLKLFRASSTYGPLTYADADKLMNNLRMPLHPKTLHRICTLNPSSTEFLDGFDAVPCFADIWSFGTPGLEI
ncbi:hypothetical protein GGR54DRAFT_610514 [Hypoxylon sp. NC1633]|nr:hypothetical protein GGR54DRAFT_610514 [Hypoxylon sp. NC1633]